MRWFPPILWQINDQLLDAANKQQRIDFIQFNAVPFWWSWTRVLWAIWGVLASIRTFMIKGSERLLPQFITFIGDYYTFMIGIALFVFVCSLWLRGIGIRLRWFTSLGAFRWYTILTLFISAFGSSQAFSRIETLISDLSTVTVREITVVIPPFGLMSSSATGMKERQLVLNPIADNNANGMYDSPELAYALWRTSPTEIVEGTVGAQIATTDGTVILEGMPKNYQDFFFPSDGMPWYSGGFTTDPDGAKKRTERLILAEAARNQAHLAFATALISVVPELINFSFLLLHIALVLTFAIVVPLAFFGDERIWIGLLIRAWVTMIIARIILNVVLQFWINLWMGTPTQPGIGTSLYGAYFFLFVYMGLLVVAFKSMTRVLRMGVVPISGRLKAAINHSSIQETLKQDQLSSEQVQQSLTDDGFESTKPTALDTVTTTMHVATALADPIGISSIVSATALADEPRQHGSHTKREHQPQIVTIQSLPDVLEQSVAAGRIPDAYTFGHATAVAGQYVQWAHASHITPQNARVMMQAIHGSPEDRATVLAHSQLSPTQQDQGWTFLTSVVERVPHHIPEANDNTHDHRITLHHDGETEGAVSGAVVQPNQTVDDGFGTPAATLQRTTLHHDGETEGAVSGAVVQPNQTVTGRTHVSAPMTAHVAIQSGDTTTHVAYDHAVNAAMTIDAPVQATVAHPSTSSELHTQAEVAPSEATPSEVVPSISDMSSSPSDSSIAPWISSKAAVMSELPSTIGERASVFASDQSERILAWTAAMEQKLFQAPQWLTERIDGVEQQISAFPSVIDTTIDHIEQRMGHAVDGAIQNTIARGDTLPQEIQASLDSMMQTFGTSVAAQVTQTIQTIDGIPQSLDRVISSTDGATTMPAKGQRVAGADPTQQRADSIQDL